MTGVQRRFQIKGDVDGILVLDDYGHHPTEIRAVLDSLAECFPDRRRVVAFQPHRYSRTHGLMDQFARCFYQSDVLLVTEIYAAGEAPLPEVSGEVLAGKIAAHGHHEIRYCPTLEDVTVELLRIAVPGDVVITLGAGSIWQAGERFLEARKAGKGRRGVRA
jgi:UDP-N-acetylmuramate--alanine ligase